MARFVAGSHARSLLTSTATRVAVLPPPPVGGVRTVDRLRGEFHDNLPTLRLSRIGTRVLPRDLAAARKLAIAEQSQRSDGIPVAVVPDATHELSARDLEIDAPELDFVVEEVAFDESAQVDTRDLWPLPSVAPRMVTNDVTTSRVVVLRERTAEYPRVAMPVTSVEISLAPLLQASLGLGYDETAVLELEHEPRAPRRWRSAIWGFAAESRSRSSPWRRCGRSRLRRSSRRRSSARAARPRARSLSRSSRRSPRRRASCRSVGRPRSRRSVDRPRPRRSISRASRHRRSRRRRAHRRSSRPGRRPVLRRPARDHDA